MKASFGTLSLLVVLAIVGLLVARQLRAPAVSTMAGPVTAASANVPMQAGQVEQRVKSDITRAFEQGAAARREADEP